AHHSPPCRCPALSFSQPLFRPAFLSSSFFFHLFGDHRDLLSFPTRRSSDLIVFDTRWAHRSGPNRSASPRIAYSLSFAAAGARRSEEHTSELQSLTNLVCRLLLEKKKSRKVVRGDATRTTAPSSRR